MTVLIEHADFLRKAELKEFMHGVEDMCSPVSEATHTEIVPAPPVALVVFLVEIMIRSYSQPGIPIHATGDGLLGRHAIHPLSIEIVPAAGVVHMGCDSSDVLDNARIKPSLELEIIGIGMSLVAHLGGWDVSLLKPS